MPRDRLFRMVDSGIWVVQAFVALQGYRNCLLMAFELDVTCRNGPSTSSITLPSSWAQGMVGKVTRPPPHEPQGGGPISENRAAPLGLVDYAPASSQAA